MENVGCVVAVIIIKFTATVLKNHTDKIWSDFMWGEFYVGLYYYFGL